MEQSKQGQIQITFHWIYIAIAGAIILLFFVGIVMKQKAVSEEQLSFEIVQIMESIFTSAGVSESTKNSVDISGLADVPFFFTCEGGVSEFGVKDIGTKVQNEIDPIFSLDEIQAPRLVLWSLPYKLPFKVIDFLVIVPSNVKFIVLGSNDFADEFIKAASVRDEDIEEGDGEDSTGHSLSVKEELLKIDVEQSSDLNVDTGESFHVRIIDTDGTHISTQIPESSPLSTFPDSKVSAVVFSGDNVQYYKKSGSAWVRNGEPVPLIIVPGERQAAKYGAIFAGDGKMYTCSMQKAFNRLTHLTKVYSLKVGMINEFYGTKTSDLCYSAFVSAGSNNLEQVLDGYSTAVETCNSGIRNSLFDYCAGLKSSAVNLMTLNKEMRDASCIALY